MSPKSQTLILGLISSLCITSTQAADEDLAARQAKGKAVFMTCAACHGMDGKGLPTTPPMAPTLIGSKLATGPAEVPTAIVLKGIQKIDAKFLGVMAPLGPTLTDDQIADVLTYIRTSFNNAGAVSASDVKAWREKYKDINAPLPRTAYEKKAEQLSAPAKDAAPSSGADAAKPAAVK